MAEPKAQPGWLVVDHIIPGCTPEMIDWWWVNMEKGYELWCPDEHKGFRWLVPPPLNGHIGAVQIATESIDYGPVRDFRIEWVNPNIGSQEAKDCARAKKSEAILQCQILKILKGLRVKLLVISVLDSPEIFREP